MEPRFWAQKISNGRWDRFRAYIYLRPHMGANLTPEIKSLLVICAMFLPGVRLAHAELMKINLASAYPEVDLQTGRSDT